MSQTHLASPVDLSSFLSASGYVVEEFTTQEQKVLSQHFSNLDRPVFALLNLPEVVKGALFARYSRSDKSLRRLFLDEFATSLEESVSFDLLEEGNGTEGGVGAKRAASLYQKVFADYGDDSVAQLGGVHLACEQASNLLTKILERPRLASFLEQSTRYVPYDVKVSTPIGMRFRMHVDPEILDCSVGKEVQASLDKAFEDYQKAFSLMQDYFFSVHPQGDDSPGVWRSAVRAQALDAVRGILPAATRSNVGVYASGQAYEALVMRLRAHPLPEARAYGQMMLEELRKVIPSFLSRADRPDRGLLWSEYLMDVRKRSEKAAEKIATGSIAKVLPFNSCEVSLTEYEADGEEKVIANMLYPFMETSLESIQESVLELSENEKTALLLDLCGKRENRRHRPGRGFEATSYCFDILADYGAFRDLQRHRLLTLDWQTLSPSHGYTLPGAIVAAGLADFFAEAMQRSKETYDLLVENQMEEFAPYAVSLAYRLRFMMRMNAREAMHVIELRTAPAGHPSYREVCQEMHLLIMQKHPSIAQSMVFVDHSDPEGNLVRLESERLLEKKASQN